MGIDTKKALAVKELISGNAKFHTDVLVIDDSSITCSQTMTTTADNSSADTAYTPMVLYNTDDTPPAASGFPIGTIYIQYTA